MTAPAEVACRRWRSRAVLSFCLAVAVGAGCADAFDPIERRADRGYSIFGQLDASADTQLIRLTPIRTVATTTADPLLGSVILTDLGSGRTITLKDSVFRFHRLNTEVGSEGRFLHNFWTTERIEPGATYRFSAALEGGPLAEAVVAIPPEYEVEVWRGQSGSRANLLHVKGVRHVAFAGFRSRIRDDCGVGFLDALFNVPSVDSDVHSIPIRASNSGARLGCGLPVVLDTKLLVVGSGQAWPSGYSYETGRLAASDLPSNVSSAVGYLGGVLTRQVPYESCLIEGFNVPSYCVLKYDESVATLRGMITDASCGSGPVAGEVTLREVEADALGHRKVRSSVGPEFEISALEPGRRYALTIRRETPLLWDYYHDHTDTLEFAAGEVRTIHVGMRRVLPCDIGP